jgi:DNA adenine methylase
MKATAHPFVKWAGGKAQLLTALSEILPQKIGTYYEPFVGGGAVFFALAVQGRFGAAVLNDTNQELMDAFKVIRDFPDELIANLKDRNDAYKASPDSAYYNWRHTDPKTLDPVARAARFIALNKTGFNGLYRVNKKGEFNVPIGKYENPRICDETNLRACSELLNRVPNTLHTSDFVNAVEGAEPGDVVYFDPPYLPLSATANFTTYTPDGFGLDDHHRLAALFKLLVEKGVSVILSNSDTEITRALYAGFEIHPVQAKRNINSKGDKRGAITELIIVGREVGPASVALELPPIPVPAVAQCLECGATFPAEQKACMECGSVNMTIVEDPEDADDETLVPAP